MQPPVIRQRPRCPWAVLVATTVLAAAAVSPVLGQGPRWQVADTGQPGQWTIYNRTARGAGLGFPLAAADMNGDGRADLILTPMNADSGPDRERISAGEAVILLSPGPFGGERDLAQLDPEALPPDVTLIYGGDLYDYLGTQVAAADLDGDGYADAVIGVQYGDGANNARANSGEAVIVWGGPDIGGRVIDLCAADKLPGPGCASPPPGAVTFIYGAAAGDRFGVWVSTGDVDGDGYADAIIGADLANPGGARAAAGMTYVVYGGPALRAATALDLAIPQLPVTAIAGIDPGDHSGATVRGADINGDGVADVLIGAGLNRLSAAIGPNGNFTNLGSGGGDGPDNRCRGSVVDLSCNMGEAYIVYGRHGERPALIDLVAPPASTTIIYGVDRNDAYGEELYAGDFDGDGRADVAIGALTANGATNTQPAAGELALIPGGPELEGAVIDLATRPAGVTFFYGARSGSIAGDTIALTDLDGDGKDELVIAAPDDRPNGRVGAGITYVFFGTATPLPAMIQLSAIPSDLPHILIDGADDGDMLAYSMSHGDVNGDGHPDLVLNVMGGDGFQNRWTDAGDAYVLDAVALTRFAGREPVTPPTPSPSPPVTPTPTPPPCPGDCNGDAAVTIDELITAVRIGLGELSLAACDAADADGNGSVEVAELVAAVSRALNGC